MAPLRRLHSMNTAAPVSNWLSPASFEFRADVMRWELFLTSVGLADAAACSARRAPARLPLGSSVSPFQSLANLTTARSCAHDTAVIVQPSAFGRKVNGGVPALLSQALPANRPHTKCDSPTKALFRRNSRARAGEVRRWYRTMNPAPKDKNANSRQIPPAMKTSGMSR